MFFVWHLLCCSHCSKCPELPGTVHVIFGEVFGEWVIGLVCCSQSKFLLTLNSHLGAILLSVVSKFWMLFEIYSACTVCCEASNVLAVTSYTVLLSFLCFTECMEGRGGRTVKGRGCYGRAFEDMDDTLEWLYIYLQMGDSGIV